MRMMSPDGELGDIPADQVEAAKADGFKLMGDADMQRLYNRMFLAHKFFEQKHPPLKAVRLPRGRGRW